jgi:hypothetical protein
MFGLVDTNAGSEGGQHFLSNHLLPVNEKKDSYQLSNSRDVRPEDLRHHMPFILVSPSVRPGEQLKRVPVGVILTLSGPKSAGYFVRSRYANKGNKPNGLYLAVKTLKAAPDLMSSRFGLW